MMSIIESMTNKHGVFNNARQILIKCLWLKTVEVLGK